MITPVAQMIPVGANRSMHKVYGLLVLLILCYALPSIGQGVAINDDNTDAAATAILDVKSTTQGVLFPRLTSAERDAISSPAAGLMIFNTDRLCIEYYTGTVWTGSEPAGSIKPYGGGSVPAGWLLCDGTAVSRTTYADLFSAVATNWGTGDGSSTFNVPDLRGRFLRGINGGTGNDPDAGSRIALSGGNTGDNVGSYQSDATSIPSNAFTTSNPGDHSHSISGFTGGGGTNINFDNDSGPTSTSTGGGGNHTHTIGGGDNETRPINAYVQYIIKY